MILDKAPNTADYAPSFYGELTEFSILYQVQNALLAELYQAMAEFYRNAFPATADRSALTRFLGFLRMEQPESTEDCRGLLVRTLSAQPPFDLAALQQICRRYLETGSVQYFPQSQTVQLKYPPNFTAVEALRQTMRAWIPAAILLLVRENYLAFNDLDAAELTWKQLDSRGLTFGTLPAAEF